jgi:hypothetical protein
MATAKDFTTIALSLEGTISAPHFDRTAFKVRRTYATLAPDGKSANIKFTHDEQQLKCEVAPEVFSAIPNGWGRQGWTRCELSKLRKAELEAALTTAWQHGIKKK